MSLSVQQQRMLEAMGLSPMHLRGAGDALRVAANPMTSDVDVRAPAREVPTAARSSLAAPPAVARPGALLEALRRAAGGRDIADLVADIERLRREPALKRALWPRLRALRRH